MKSISSSQWPELVIDHLKGATKPLIAVVGPTASGKTGFSIKLCQFIAQSSDEHGWKIAEVVNADSRQLYKYMDIGTAKITEEEKQGIVHHLFDVLEPDEDVTIAEYKLWATEMIDEIHARKHVPVLVGGSMLYISAVVDGLEPLPAAPKELREKIEAEYDTDDGWSLYDKLMQIDPATAKNFDLRNKAYVVRAIELWEMTGVQPSKLKKTVPPPYQILLLGINRPREELKERIERRTDILLSSGWIEEAESLIDRGYTPASPGMKSHGYREILQWLSSEERNIEELKEVINRKTKQYAKRQGTWWNDDERIYWISDSE